MRKLFLVLAVLALPTAIMAGIFGTITGSVIDSSDLLSFTAMTWVVVYDSLEGVDGACIEGSGNYTIEPIPPGTYDVEFSSVGYKKLRFKGVVISPDTVIKIDVLLNSLSDSSKTSIIHSYRSSVGWIEGTISPIISDTLNNGNPWGRVLGLVLDKETREPIPGVTVIVGGDVIDTTDEGGYYNAFLDPGIKRVELLKPGYRTKVIRSVRIKAVETTYVHTRMEPEGTENE